MVRKRVQRQVARSEGAPIWNMEQSPHRHGQTDHDQRNDRTAHKNSALSVSVTAALVGLAMVTLATGCASNKREESLKNGRDISIYLSVSDSLVVDGTWVSTVDPVLYSVLLDDNTRALEQSIDSNSSEWASFGRVRSIRITL